MGPLQEVPISTHGEGELVAGSVTVDSNGSIGGVLRFDLPGVGVAAVGASEPARDTLFFRPGGRREVSARRELSATWKKKSWWSIAH